MIKRLIYLLIRKRLGLDILEPFQFVNQRSDHDYYYFGRDCIYKVPYGGEPIPSNVSLNWLMDKDCRIYSMPRNRVI